MTRTELKEIAEKNELPLLANPAWMTRPNYGVRIAAKHWDGENWKLLNMDGTVFTLTVEAESRTSTRYGPAKTDPALWERFVSEPTRS